jgi:hypothetical protein
MNTKLIAQNDFKGGMDTDTQVESISPFDYLYALNIRNNSTGSGDVLGIKNIMGNTLIPFSLPPGKNVVIGSLADEVGFQIIYWIYNSSGYHTILSFNIIGEYIEKIIQSITDTGGVDIFQFSLQGLILNPVLINNDLLYWVDQGINPARKINITKIRDGSYADISLDIINAYKRAPYYAPTCSYGNDLTRQNNNLYRHTFKFAYQYIYDDNEQSTYSDFSILPNPVNEPYNGSLLNANSQTASFSLNQNNNFIAIIINTGFENVSQINIVAQIDGLNWVLVQNINKNTLSLGNNSNYTLNFYNDGEYNTVDVSLLIQPYSYLPANPFAQELVNNKIMAYTGFKEGFNNLIIQVGSVISYAAIDFSGSTTPILSNPPITFQSRSGAIQGNYNLNRWQFSIDFTNNPLATGMVFTLYSIANETEQWIYTVTPYTKPLDVANYFFELSFQIVGDAEKKAFDLDYPGNTPTQSGSVVTFNVYKSFARNNIPNLELTVISTYYTSISLSNLTQKVNKSGSIVQYGIIYEDFEGRKTQVFTNSSWKIYSKSFMELGSIQWASHQLSISHTPPPYAVRFQIVRTQNLNFATFTQFYTQAINLVANNGRNDFLDLVMQGINIYHKIYPENIIAYTFNPGDRCRFLYYLDNSNAQQIFISNSSSNFNEVEVVEMRYNTQYQINTDAVLQGSGNTTLSVVSTDASKIGMLINLVTSANIPVQRRITGIQDSTHYQIDQPINDLSTIHTYTFIDDRLIIRVKNPYFPNLPGLSTGALPVFALVELFTPGKNTGIQGSQVYFEFGQKYDIQNPGLPTAYHNGQAQNQTAIQPALFNISNGDTYARLREMPKVNAYPGVTSNIGPVEDYNFSDFYPSAFNDNGRPEAESPLAAESYFPERIRYSLSFIPGSNINGINQFLYSNFIDYSDSYGAIMRMYYRDSKLYILKQLITGFTNVFKVQVKLADDSSQLLTSNNIFENQLHYYTFKGGIGNNPESFAENGLQIYFASANAGAILRLSLDGLIPISTKYKMDKFFRNLLTYYANSGGRIFGVYDRKNEEYILAFQNTSNAIYTDVFNGNAWQTNNQNQIDSTTFQIITPPTHGTLSAIDSTGNVTYTPNAGYSGPDSFSYTAKTPAGIQLPAVNECINVISPTRPTGWRGTGQSCPVDGSGNQTGFVVFANLEQYYIDTITGGNISSATATGQTKANTPTISGNPNPDYIAPFYDINICPVGTTFVIAVTYQANLQGAVITLGSGSFTVPNNNAGTGSFSTPLTVGSSASMNVTLPKASGQGVSVNGGSIQNITPATSGNQTLTFTATITAGEAISVSLYSQSYGYVADTGTAICEKTLNIGATISGFSNPYSIICISSINKTFVANYGSGTVSVIDSNPANPTFNTILATITVPGAGGGLPRALLFVSGIIYLLDQNQGIFTIDINTYAIFNIVNQSTLGTSGGGTGPLSFIYSSIQGGFVVPLFSLSSTVAGKTSGTCPVKVFSPTGTLIKTIIISDTSANELTNTIVRPTYVAEDTVSGDLYFSDSNVGANSPIRVYTVHQGDLFNYNTLQLPSNSSDTSRRMAWIASSRKLYVPCGTTQKVFIIDTNPGNVSTFNTILANISFPSVCGDAIYIPAISALYVCSRTGSSIFVVNTTNNTFTIGNASSAPISLDYNSSIPGIYIVNYDSGTTSQLPYPNSLVNDGKLIILNLLQNFSGSGVLTGTSVPNVVGNPNYIAPYVNTTTCPIGM